VASRDDARARLEAQAAEILGQARQEATELLRKARVDADEVRFRANKYAAERVAEADAAREHARRQLVQAQEQALAIRSDAQRAADSLLKRATARARTEADELLREAQRQLARAVQGAREAEARAVAARAAEAEALDRLLAMPTADERRQPARGAAVTAGEEDDGWLIDLTRDMNNPLEDLVAGAVRNAVRKSVNPVVVRAGRYTVIRDANTDN
jgi:F0F1-type ATP synthase membrane subunit b/b'